MKTMIPTIYLSGPISGPDYNSNVQHFNEEALRLRGLGYFVINPCELAQSVNYDGTIKYDDAYYDVLKRDCIALLSSDVVVTLPKWEDSKGANIEIQLANSIRIPVVLSNTITDIFNEELIDTEDEQASTAASST